MNPAERTLAREITIAALVEEVERDDAFIAVGAKKGLMLATPAEGMKLLRRGKKAWEKEGFHSREELLIAIHACKSKGSAPMALIASFGRFESRQMRREQQTGIPAASSVVLPAPALRSKEDEDEAAEVEMGVK